MEHTDESKATLHRVYVQFGRGLIDEYGDSVDFLVDTKPFEGGIEYAPAPEIERLRAIEERAKERVAAYEEPPPLYRDRLAVARYILKGGQIA